MSSNAAYITLGMYEHSYSLVDGLRWAGETIWVPIKALWQ